MISLGRGREQTNGRLQNVINIFVSVYLRCDSMTLLMKLTMAEAGCSGSNSANRWQTFSAKLPGFLATKPKTLREKETERRGSEGNREERVKAWHCANTLLE